MKNRATVVVDIVLAAAIIWGGIAVFAAPKAGSSAAADPQPPSLTAMADSLLGRSFPALGAYAPKGERRTVSIATSGAPTLLIVFRSDCRFCEETAPQWKRLLELGGTERVIALNAEDPRTAARWLGRHQLRPGDTWVPSDLRAYADAWKLRVVPATMVIEHGRVTYARLGVLHATDVADVAVAMRLGKQDPPISK